MNWRDDVRLPDVPFRWRTNLDDAGIRRVYRELAAQLFLPAEDANSAPSADPTGPARMRLSMNAAKVEMDDGQVECVRFGDSIVARFRSHGEIRLTNAARQEVGELRAEQERARAVESIVFRQTDADLREQIALALDAERYDDVRRLVYERYRISQECQANNRQELTRESLEAFRYFPSADDGIYLLRATEAWPREILDFAGAYLRDCRACGDQRLVEVERVVSLACDHPNQRGTTYAAAIDLWERQSEYVRAIRCAMSAIDHGLDGEAGGAFRVALARLMRKAGLVEDSDATT